jgi:hypothetical protein
VACTASACLKSVNPGSAVPALGPDAPRRRRHRAAPIDLLEKRPTEVLTQLMPVYSPANLPSGMKNLSALNPPRTFLKPGRRSSL